jgi:hypothetical protein
MSPGGPAAPSSPYASPTCTSRPTTPPCPVISPALRRWNLWGYVDSRDVAQACRLAVEAQLSGAHRFLVAAADTIMTATNSELLADQFPDLELTRPVGDHETLLSIDKARAMLGYAPQYSWRDREPGVRRALTGCPISALRTTVVRVLFPTLGRPLSL